MTAEKGIDLSATVTVDGIAVTVDRRRIEDIRVLRAIRDLQRGGDDAQVWGFLDLMDEVFGEEQTAAIEAAIRERNDGFAPASEYLRVLSDAFAQVNELKN